MVKKWKTLGQIDKADYKIFNLIRVNRASAIDDKKGEFVLVDSPNWVMVIPVVINSAGEECFLMVRQYRHGSDSITLEFPAGMVDRGEESITAAKRELLEETGYKPETIEKVGSVNPNPAFMTNKTTTYVAKGLKLISEQKLDQNEEIEVVIVPQKEFESKIGGNEVNSAITIQSYYFYLKSLA